MASEKKLKVFAVTGVSHGSIVYAPSIRLARAAFYQAWEGERIIKVKRIRRGYTF